MLPIFTVFPSTPCLVDPSTGFATIDGYYVSKEDGEAALRKGLAVVIGGLLVGLVATFD